MKAALASEDPVLKSAALGAAMRLNILDHKLLKMSLADPAERVRRRALELAPRLAAATGSAAELIPAVLELLADDACAELAAFTLGELEIADPAVVAGLEHQARHHDDPLCRESAVAALGALAAGRGTVLAATTDIATVRRRAVIALAAFDGPEVDAALEQALTDRDWQVRQAAEEVLGPPLGDDDPDDGPEADDEA